MIKFKIEAKKVVDGDRIREFPEDIYVFENTLLAMKKWEALYQKPWKSDTPHTHNELMYYFKCMNVEDREIYPELLTAEQIDALSKYLANPMGAHRLPKATDNSPRGSKIVYTAEVIYAYCILNNIPLDWAEKQNLNQLITILGVVAAIQAPPEKQKMSLADRRKLNQQRRSQLNSRG